MREHGLERVRFTRRKAGSKKERGSKHRELSEENKEKALNKNLVGGTEFQCSSEKSCLSHKLLVTLSSVAVSRQMERSRVSTCFMWLIWTLGNQDEPMIVLVL